MDREVKMPNIVMHHHFGKVVYSALSDEVKKSIPSLATSRETT